MHATLKMAITMAMTVAVMWSAGRAQTTVHYVSATDPGCGGQSPCYGSVQAAVNAAQPGDQIRVAAGLYAGTTDAVVDGVPYTQHVLITKSLTLEGGYTETDWNTSAPSANPTVIDAQGHGRAITIVGNGTQAVIISGLTLTGGDYSELGNGPNESHFVCVRTGSDCGGGLFAFGVTLILRDCLIMGNVAGRTKRFSDGGGAFLWLLNDGSRIENTRFVDNAAPAAGGSGAGLQVEFGGSFSIVNSSFEANRAQGRGGAVHVFQPSGRLSVENTAFVGNTAGEEGGALEALLIFKGEALALDRVRFQSNVGAGQGAALSVSKQGNEPSLATLTNVLFAANDLTAASSAGAVIYAVGGSGERSDFALNLAHVTFANQPTLAALYVYGETATTRANLVNTLISSATTAFVGEQVETGVVAFHHDHTLLDNVRTVQSTVAGTPAFEAVGTVNGSAMLDASFHLQAGSAAIDTGIDAGVSVDLDGDVRPQGGGYDIGADELALP